MFGFSVPPVETVEVVCGVIALFPMPGFGVWGNDIPTLPGVIPGVVLVFGEAALIASSLLTKESYSCSVKVISQSVGSALL